MSEITVPSAANEKKIRKVSSSGNKIHHNFIFSFRLSFRRVSRFIHHPILIWFGERCDRWSRRFPDAVRSDVREMETSEGVQVYKCHHGVLLRRPHRSFVVVKAVDQVPSQPFAHELEQEVDIARRQHTLEKRGQLQAQIEPNREHQCYNAFSV